MWEPGDVITWRGIYRERIWHVQPTILVKNSPEEVVLTLLPGTECIAEENYEAIIHGVIPLEWTREIDAARDEVFDRLEERQYPFDGSWLDWKPDPGWQPPRLPENWDKI